MVGFKTFLKVIIQDELPYADILKSFFYQYYNLQEGYLINIFIEGSHNIGLDLEQVVSLLCSFLVQKRLSNHFSFTVDSQNLLKMSYELAKKISGYTNLLAIYTAFYGGKNPYVSSEIGVISFEKQIKNIVTLKEFFSKTNGSLSNRSIDYCVVYSGVPLHNHFNYRNSFKLPDIEEGTAYSEKSKKKLWSESNFLLNDLNVRSGKALSRLLYSPLDEIRTTKCVAIFNRSRLFLSIFERISPSYNTSISKFRNAKNAASYTKSVIPHDRFLGGGCVSVVTLYNRARADVKETLETSIQKEFPGAYMHYASWEDGQEENGMILEQDLENGHIHPVIGRELYIFRKFDGSYIMGQFEEIITNPDVDIIFDTAEMKIYIGGKRVTAKQIFSQVTAVEMMQYFFENQKTSIRNTELPRNSFTKCKNSLNSKIIYPLKNIVLERLGKKMNLHASGTLGVFEISFYEEFLNVGILEKIA